MSDEDGSEFPSTLIKLNQEQVEVPGILPVLPVRDVVVFPGVTVPLAIGRPRSLAALEIAGQGGYLIVATQRDPTTEGVSIANRPTVDGLIDDAPPVGGALVARS